MVTVGTQFQIVDTGILSITNKRVAYLGSRKTIDMPYPKLLGSRCSPTASRSRLEPADSPLFKVTCDADLLGAMLNAAAQHTTSVRLRLEPIGRGGAWKRAVGSSIGPTRSSHLARGRLGWREAQRERIESHASIACSHAAKEPILDLAVVVRLAAIAFSSVFARACPARHA